MVIGTRFVPNSSTTSNTYCFSLSVVTTFFPTRGTVSSSNFTDLAFFTSQLKVTGTSLNVNVLSVLNNTSLSAKTPTVTDLETSVMPSRAIAFMV